MRAWLVWIAAVVSTAVLQPAAARRWTLAAALLAGGIGICLTLLRGIWRRYPLVWQRLMGVGGTLVLTLLLLAGWTRYFLPDRLPQRMGYDLIENRQLTIRLVDPSLVKVETWEIDHRTQPVLFTHPGASGNTTLVYPVMIQPESYFAAEIALAPQSWEMEGDGAVFSVYVEDRTGMHLIFSEYIDPKHHQQDRRWLPVRIDLGGYAGELVRLILSVNSGPAGDARNDWAGWGTPRLEVAAWP